MKVSYLLAAVAILGLAGFAMAAKGARGNKTSAGLIGKVVTVDAEKKTVTVKAKTGEVTVDASAATVTIDGADGKLADLKAGMVVTVTPATGAAEKIVAKTATTTHKKKGQ